LAENILQLRSNWHLLSWPASNTESKLYNLQNWLLPDIVERVLRVKKWSKPYISQCSCEDVRFHTKANMAQCKKQRYCITGH